MTSLHEIELNWIVTLQGDGAWRQLAVWLSYLGDEAIPCVLATVYFCVSRKKGARLYLLFGFSSCVLQSLQMAFRSPRPYWVDGRVKALTRVPIYGLPSGHVLAVAVVWPFVAKLLKASWAWGIAFGMVFLVSASRVYLGVHFISDVVAAWALAALLLWGFSFSESKLRSRLDSINGWYQAGAGLLGAAGLIALGMGIHWFISGTPDPPAWAAVSRGARDLTGLFHSGGKFFGAAYGIVMAVRWARFDATRVAWWNRVGCVTYALAGAWLIRELLGTVSIPTRETIRWASAFATGAILNGWLLFLAPWILLKTGLLKTAATSDRQPSHTNSALAGNMDVGV